jgi:hypothetical protein
MTASHQPHPTTIFFTVHKGASTFATHGIAPLARKHFPDVEHREYGPLLAGGADAADHPLPATNVIATRVYPWLYDELVEDPKPAGGRFADKKLVVMRRDPRDVAVSSFYSRAYSHPVPARDPDEFLRIRAELRELGPLEGVRQHCAQSALYEFRCATMMLERYPHAIDLPYELLVTEPRAWVAMLGAYLDWPDRVIDALADEVPLHVQAPDTEQPTKHKRRVTPGNWLTLFDDDLNGLFIDAVGTEMAAAGYELVPPSGLPTAA